jgi:hypothetical protein
MAMPSMQPFASPYAMFDPTQWSNQFSNYNNQALPWPPQYVGAPTNATGQPIQSPMGTTINSQPASAAAPAAAAQSSSSPFANVQIPQGQNTAVAQPRGGLSPTDWQALTPQQRSAASNAMGEYSSGLAMMPSGNNFVASGSNPSGSNPQASNALAWMNRGGADFNQMANQSQAAPPAAAPQGQNTMSLNNALSLLANPGHVDTPGATVPQSSAYQPQNSVLQQFLQNWQPAQSGPGSQFQRNFAGGLGGT